MLCFDTPVQTNRTTHTLPFDHDAMLLCSRPWRPLIRRVGHHARLISDLGLRAQLPPDSQHQFDHEDDVPRVSDQEWEIRTG